MKFLFITFSLLLLIICELLIGNLGIFCPLVGLGVFYFSGSFGWKFGLIISLFLAIIMDFILYTRILFPDFFIYCFCVYLAFKWQKFNRKDFWFNAFPGGIIFFVNNIIFGMLIYFTQKNNEDFINIIALSISSIAIGYSVLLVVFSILEFIAEKLKLELFVKNLPKISRFSIRPRSIR